MTVLNDSLTFLNITPGLTRITVTPNADKTQFRVRFDFGVSPPRESLTLGVSRVKRSQRTSMC